MQRWLAAGQDKVWNEKVASRLLKRFQDPKHLSMLRTVSSLVKGKSVLDVGCGFALLSQFLPEGTEYLGVDQSEDMLKIASKKFPKAKLLNENLYNLQLEKFDTVVALDFLHHQPDLEPAFSKLISLTNERLIVSLWIWGRLPRAKKKYLGHHGEIIYWKTTEELNKKFSELNYKVVERVSVKWRDIYYFDIRK